MVLVKTTLLLRLPLVLLHDKRRETFDCRGSLLSIMYAHTLPAIALTAGWPSSRRLVRVSNCCCSEVSYAAAPVRARVIEEGHEVRERGRYTIRARVKTSDAVSTD